MDRDPLTKYNYSRLDIEKYIRKYIDSINPTINSNILVKISIIIPVYNTAPYVEECIRSVLEQDYKDLEIIIVDDCGTDNSMQLIEDIISNASRDIIIVKHPFNRGLSGARNTGIRQAVGEYIYFLDSDDYLLPHCFVNLVQIASKYPDADLVYGMPQTECSSLLNVTAMKNLEMYYRGRKKLKKMLLKGDLLPVSAWNRLIKRKWLLENRLFFKEGIVHEDSHWNFFVAKYVKSIAICKETTYYYRSNPNGIMNSQLQKRQESMDIILKDWARHLDCRCLPLQLYAIFWVAHTCYVMRFGGEGRRFYIRMFYPFIYLVKLFCHTVTNKIK